MTSASKFLYRDCLIGAGICLHLFFYSVENVQFYASALITFLLSAAFLLKIEFLKSFIELLQLSINISFFTLIGQWLYSSSLNPEGITNQDYYLTAGVLGFYVALSLFSHLVHSRSSEHEDYYE